MFSNRHLKYVNHDVYLFPLLINCKFTQVCKLYVRKDRRRQGGNRRVKGGGWKKGRMEGGGRRVEDGGPEEGRKNDGRGARTLRRFHSPYRILRFDKDLRHIRQSQPHSQCQCTLSHKHRCTPYLRQHPHTLHCCGRERTCSNQCPLNSWHQRIPLHSHICIR